MTRELAARPLVPPGVRVLRVAAVVIAGIGALGGVWLMAMHLGTDPFADTRAYYDAGTRLNSGLPLYDPSAATSVGLYLYPPLIAILFRPLALLPFPLAAAIWEVALLGAVALTLRHIGLRWSVAVALGWLAIPLGWALAVGQAEPIITLLLTLGTPASIALAGHIKLVPWLAAAWWAGRRDARALRSFLAWVVLIGLCQFAIEPNATLAYLRLEWLGPAFEVRNLSPFGVSPILWAALFAVLLVLTLRQSRTRAGWPLAVGLAVLTYPRLLIYQLFSLLAAFGGPRPSEPDRGRAP